MYQVIQTVQRMVLVRQSHSFDRVDRRAVAMQLQSSNDPEDGNDGRVLPCTVHDSASGTSEASDSGTSETSYTTLAGDGHASCEVRVTSIRTAIIILATRTREASSEKGPRIREETPVVQKRLGFQTA